MNKRIIGTVQVAAAALSWSVSGVFCKWLPWHSLTVNGIRAIFAAFLLGIVRGSWRVKLTKGTLLGAFGVASTSMLFMAATKRTSAANAIVLQYAMPVFVILFCWLFYGQRPTKRDLITAGCVLGGVILCSWEGLTGGGNMIGDLLALLSAVTFALVFFCSRLPDTNANDYAFLGVILCIPSGLMGFADPGMSLQPVQWLAILGMGVGLASGYFFIARGMANTSPTTAAIVANLEPIANPLWVFLFLGERPSPWTLVGAVVVLVAATLYSIVGQDVEVSPQTPLRDAVPKDPAGD